MPRRGPYTPLWRPPSRAIRRNDDAPTSDRKFIRNDLEPTCNVALFPPRPTFFSSKRRDKRDIPDNAPPPARTVGNYGLIPRNWNNSVSEPRRSNNCPISLRSQLSSIPPFSSRFFLSTSARESEQINISTRTDISFRDSSESLSYSLLSPERDSRNFRAHPSLEFSSSCPAKKSRRNNWVS